MSAKRKTGFDKYFDQRMKEPSFAAQYRETRAAIDATDTLIRALEMARASGGLLSQKKAHFARAVDRRLTLAWQECQEREIL